MNAFIIHSTIDKERVNELKDSISDKIEGFNALVLENGGALWKIGAMNKINEAQVVIFFAGENSFKSKYIAWELKKAIKKGKQIFTVPLNKTNKIHPVLIKRDPYSDTPRIYGKVVSIDELANRINNHINDEYSLFNGDNIKEDQNLLFEQYKLFLETSETLVERRQKISHFFILTNTLLVSLVGTIVALEIEKRYMLLLCAVLSIVGLILAFSWMRIIEAYGSLNSSKMKIISMIEKKLPISLFDIEWEILSDQLNMKRYTPFTQIEKSVPQLFMLIYGTAILGVIITFIL